MNRALAECIVDCLRLDGSPVAYLDRVAEFDERDWRRTLGWLDNSGLALYFLQRLRDLRAENRLPASIQRRLKGNLEQNRLRVAAMAEEFGALNRRFEDAGLRYAVLKGFSLIPEYCPDGALRLQTDYDYLVDLGSSESAQSVLRLAGYFRSGVTGPANQPWELRFRAEPLRWPGWHDDFYSFLDPRLIELHFAPWKLEQYDVDATTPEGPLERTVERTWHGVRFNALNDDDTLVLEVLHAFEHMLGYWCRLSCFLEIARFLRDRSSDRSFWTGFRKHAHDHARLAEIITLVFSMAIRLFGGEIPPGGWMGRPLPPTLSSWVERYGRAWALENWPGSKLTLFLYSEFIRDEARRRRFLFRRLIPLHRSQVLSDAKTPAPRGSAKANLQKWAFVFGRGRFHCLELLRYVWRFPSWRRTLRRSSAGTLDRTIVCP